MKNILKYIFLPLLALAFVACESPNNCGEGWEPRNPNDVIGSYNIAYDLFINDEPVLNEGLSGSVFIGPTSSHDLSAVFVSNETDDQFPDNNNVGLIESGNITLGGNVGDYNISWEGPGEVWISGTKYKDVNVSVSGTIVKRQSPRFVAATRCSPAPPEEPDMYHVLNMTVLAEVDTSDAGDPASVMNIRVEVYDKD